MTSSPSKDSTYMVDAYSDPILVRIQGRACFQNSSPLKDFFRSCVMEGKKKFLLDFRNCSGMDSTFLGVVAGLALQLRKLHPPGSLVLARLGTRNLELVRNLGLHRLATVDQGQELVDGTEGETIRALENGKIDELTQARLCLEAHENLVAADESNRLRFQDVLSLLKQRVEEA